MIMIMIMFIDRINVKIFLKRGVYIINATLN